MDKLTKTGIVTISQANTTGISFLLSTFSPQSYALPFANLPFLRQKYRPEIWERERLQTEQECSSYMIYILAQYPGSHKTLICHHYG